MNATASELRATGRATQATGSDGHTRDDRILRSSTCYPEEPPENRSRTARAATLASCIGQFRRIPIAWVATARGRVIECGPRSYARSPHAYSAWERYRSGIERRCSWHRQNRRCAPLARPLPRGEHEGRRARLRLASQLRRVQRWRDPNMLGHLDRSMLVLTAGPDHGREPALGGVHRAAGHRLGAQRPLQSSALRPRVVPSAATRERRGRTCRRSPCARG